MKKKRIVFFINTLYGGGAEHQLVMLADGLIEKSYDVTITTFGDAPDYYTYSSSIRRHRIAQGKNSILKLLAIWKYFLTVKADCVIGFGHRESSYMLLPLLLRSRKRIKVIAGERSLFFGSCSKKTIAIYNILYQRADYIVPNSFAQRKKILEIKPEYAEKTITITNYTDTSTYKVTSLQNAKILKIGVFGRYDIPKNCIRFVESIRLLVAKSDQKFTIVWYGNMKIGDTHSNPLYEEMFYKVQQYGLEDYIVLNDQIKNVPKAMAEYDAIALPSLWEGFSNAIGEAICCGKPCLVSDVGDNSVMVKEGINGFLFDPQNEESIVDAFLKYFALSTEEKQAMGIASRKRAEELFDRDKFINAYIKLIES